MVRVGSLVVTGMLLLASCGGSADNGSATTVSDAEAATTTPSPAATTTRPADDSPAAPSGSATDRCEALFATSEMTDLFGEEAVLDEAETVEAIGQLLCVWSTIEDLTDTTDLSYQLLILQLYEGDPIPGENFFDASFYPDARPLDGIGDEAFLDVPAPNNFTVHFLDGTVYGTISYVEADPGSPGGPAGMTDAQAIDLLRTFHGRATG